MTRRRRRWRRAEPRARPGLGSARPLPRTPTHSPAHPPARPQRPIVRAAQHFGKETLAKALIAYTKAQRAKGRLEPPERYVGWGVPLGDSGPRRPKLSAAKEFGAAWALVGRGNLGAAWSPMGRGFQKLVGRQPPVPPSVSAQKSALPPPSRRLASALGSQLGRAVVGLALLLLLWRLPRAYLRNSWRSSWRFRIPSWLLGFRLFRRLGWPIRASDPAAPGLRTRSASATELRRERRGRAHASASPVPRRHTAPAEAPEEDGRRCAGSTSVDGVGSAAANGSASVGW